MTIIKQAIIELMLLTLASVGVALAANEIRERKAIDLTKDYFKKSSDAPRHATDLEPKANTAASPVAKSADPKHPATTARSSTEKPTPAPARKHIEHDFQTVTVDEAHEILDDPKTGQGLNVFVDARDDENFAEGHIPGAIQCFPYEIQLCIDRVSAAAMGAEKVIVYCGGGDCEDSIFMSRELQDMGVPYDAIYLFEGGWKEWSAKGLHTEKGPS